MSKPDNKDIVDFFVKWGALYTVGAVLESGEELAKLMKEDVHINDSRFYKALNVHLNNLAQLRPVRGGDEAS